jgi:hypothetical protein
MGMMLLVLAQYQKENEMLYINGVPTTVEILLLICLSPLIMIIVVLFVVAILSLFSSKK